MKTFEELKGYALASSQGKTASQLGHKLDKNPYGEDDERHWRWLDAWCVEETEKRKRRSDPPLNADVEPPRERKDQ